MQIVCTTTLAAADVLSLLLIAGLRPVRDFEIRPALSTTPPITFMMLVSLPAMQVGKIRAVPYTTVSG